MDDSYHVISHHNYSYSVPITKKNIDAFQNSKIYGKNTKNSLHKLKAMLKYCDFNTVRNMTG